MQCEMCGKENMLVPAIVEGTEIMVCGSCAKHGKVLKRPVLKTASKEIQRETIVQTIVPDFGVKIRQGREGLGLKQKALAMKMGERESVIQSIEVGKHEPSLRLARKFEKFLKIKLVDQGVEIKYEGSTEEMPGMTIADLLKK